MSVLFVSEDYSCGGCPMYKPRYIVEHWRSGTCNCMCVYPFSGRSGFQCTISSWSDLFQWWYSGWHCLCYIWDNKWRQSWVWSWVYSQPLNCHSHWTCCISALFNGCNHYWWWRYAYHPLLLQVCPFSLRKGGYINYKDVWIVRN